MNRPKDSLAGRANHSVRVRKPTGVVEMPLRRVFEITDELAEVLMACARGEEAGYDEECNLLREAIAYLAGAIMGRKQDEVEPGMIYEDVRAPFAGAVEQGDTDQINTIVELQLDFYRRQLAFLERARAEHLNPQVEKPQSDVRNRVAAWLRRIMR